VHTGLARVSAGQVTRRASRPRCGRQRRMLGHVDLNFRVLLATASDVVGSVVWRRTSSGRAESVGT